MCHFLAYIVCRIASDLLALTVSNDDRNGSDESIDDESQTTIRSIGSLSIASLSFFGGGSGNV